jgi:hypothetical protein
MMGDDDRIIIERIDEHIKRFINFPLHNQPLALLLDCKAAVVRLKENVEQLREELADAQYARNWLWHPQPRALVYPEFLARMGAMRLTEGTAKPPRKERDENPS